VFVLSSFIHGQRRLLVGLLLVCALLFNSVGTLFAAGTTGTISGTVTDSKTGAPVAGVAIAAVSPTGQYHGRTNERGYFSFIGVTPDTYTVSYELAGFQPLSTTAITVAADQVADVSTRLTKSLSTIGRVTVRSEGNAYQPKQTQDTYTVTNQQVATLLGKTDAVSETDLLTRLPGASLDRYGYPVLRGGRENEEGFQFDGIPEVDAFTSQFTNSLSLNPGVNQLQLTPGTGDVSTGNAGTGSINLIAKRGTYPAFGQVDVEALAAPFDHQLGLEYGFASPSGAISNYVSFLGITNSTQYGQRGTPAQRLSLGTVYDNNYETSRDLLENFVFKFGRNRSQSVQLLYNNQQSNFLGTYGTNNLQYPTNDPYFLANAENFTGLTQEQLQSPTLIGLLPFQPSLTSPLGTRGGTQYYQPNNVFKIQYSNNLSAASFITAKYYQLDSVTTFDFPNNVAGVVGFASFSALQGGHRTGGTLDFSTQFNSQHLLQSGLEYDFLHPVYDQINPLDGLFAVSGFNAGYEANDFINPAAPGNLGSCPLVTDPNGTSYCGYLTKYLGPTPGPIPYNLEQTVTNRQDFAFYLRDKFTPNDRTNVDFGVRLEGAHYRLPPLTGCNPTLAQVVAGTQPDTCQYYPTGYNSSTVGGTTYGVPFVTVSDQQRSPFLVEPRIAVSYQLTKNDSVRASFGRSAEFAPLAFVDLIDPAGHYAAYAGIPSYDVFANFQAGTPFNPAAYPAHFCGVTGNLACQNYADQLHWENQNFLQGVPIQPVKPETFSNWEASYSHQFPNGIGMKITPFYRRGYDALALVAQPRIGANGAPLTDPATGDILLGPSTATNLGINRTTGVEFFLSREAAYGLSGSISATYINEFSNVVPSPLIQEDFFPPIPTQSLALGNQYRVGFVSPFNATLAVSYKTHNGFRFNPIITYTRGYPAGVGNITAAYVNGVAYNIPNTNTAQGSAFGANLSPNFVDPQNPGSAFKPNIAATRGTPETASAGGFITNPRLRTNVSLEYSTPRGHNTFGVLVTNLFNQTYSGVPTYNSRYQAVATGIAGPKTGYSRIPVLYPEIGSQQYLPFQFGNDPYRIVPNSTPQTIRLYYQLGL